MLIELGVLNEKQYLECFSKHTELMRQGVVVTERATAKENIYRELLVEHKIIDREGRLIRMAIKK